MASKIFSAATVGLSGAVVEVEVDVLSQGLHNFTLVGLPDMAVKESRDRVSSALKNSGFRPPHQCGRITVNLAPADLPKSSPIYDLPLAVGFLLATKQIAFDPENKLLIGELSLDGRVRPVQGVLPVALLAKERGFAELFVPLENAAEAAVVGGVKVYPVKTLLELMLHFTGERLLDEYVLEELPLENQNNSEPDMAEIQGQEQAKRALEIAAAGGHNLLMSGPPGSGKTLLAKALAGILPKLNLTEALEITKIFSVAGKLGKEQALVNSRPYRAPHHSASGISLVGGGSYPRPGEISLAHRGVLFLDEFPEFPRTVLENLRQPLEDGIITISRAKGSLEFPARFVLVAAMNPCYCGNASDPEKICTCSPAQIAKYQQKISGPIMDRIDLRVEVPRLPFEKLQHGLRGEDSSTIRERVEKARQIQTTRFAKGYKQINAEMGPEEIRQHCQLDETCLELLKKAVSALKLSARGYHRIIKVARTIADLAGAKQIAPEHVAEAIQYRLQNE